MYHSRLRSSSIIVQRNILINVQSLSSTMKLNAVSANWQYIVLYCQAFWVGYVFTEKWSYLCWPLAKQYSSLQRCEGFTEVRRKKPLPCTSDFSEPWRLNQFNVYQRGVCLKTMHKMSRKTEFRASDSRSRKLVNRWSRCLIPLNGHTILCCPQNFTLLPFRPFNRKSVTLFIVYPTAVEQFSLSMNHPKNTLQWHYLSVRGVNKPYHRKELLNTFHLNGNMRYRIPPTNPRAGTTFYSKYVWVALISL